MRTDYFDDLLPDSVTTVTRQKTGLVTPENRNVTLKNNELGEVLPVLPLLPVKTSNTEKKTEQSAERYAYRFRLHDNEGGGTYLTDEPDLDKARDSLTELFGERLAMVVKA